VSELSLLQRIAAALVSRPLVYDLVQSLAGQGYVVRRMKAKVGRLPHARVLDVGSSAGRLALRLGLAPVCLDLDARPILAIRRRGETLRAVVGDAAVLPFPDAHFDLCLCVALFHHIDEATLVRVIGELARVTAGHLLLLDPLRNERRKASRWLWKYDRGRHPRTREELTRRLEPAFRIIDAEEFTVYHQYLLCVAAPSRPPATAAGRP
jgi:SAM-dependent methyltransferase